MKILLPVICAFCIGVLSILSEPVNAKPVITWQPKNVTVTAGRGGSTISRPITLTSDTNLTNVHMHIVPEIKDFITGVPQHPFNIHKGETLYNLEVHVRHGTPLGVYEGPLHVKKGKKTIAKPLPVTIVVGEVIDSSGGELTFDSGDVTLTVPPGAVSGETIFTVKKVASEDIGSLPTWSNILGLVYDFGPD